MTFISFEPKIIDIFGVFDPLSFDPVSFDPMSVSHGIWTNFLLSSSILKVKKWQTTFWKYRDQLIQVLKVLTVNMKFPLGTNTMQKSSFNFHVYWDTQQMKNQSQQIIQIRDKSLQSNFSIYYSSVFLLLDLYLFVCIQY